ncbi:protein kinase superfamily protein [Artemisia annua]|uniref:Protein kinase superfamily protein n=1 Tax=Artemisia annua TaxID=35608 RepID=A0A2U1NTY6_ARTAN|nr:protein kinase superfamily protein [Artemisia annua]
MDSRSAPSSPKLPHAKLGYVGCKSKELGIDKDLILKADILDLKMQLDKQLAKAAVFKKSEIEEEWEIDLSKLDIKSVIAYGTHGIVYKGVYNGRDVAVKVLDWGEDGLHTTAEILALRKDFSRAVEVWQKLDHPNVTKFIGASMGTSELNIPSDEGKTCLRDGSCCVVVEYVPGGTLKKYLIENIKKKLSLRTVVKISLELARGLSYLHSKKIVHRDVKTENMLLDANGTLKIADFGVARVEAKNPKDMTGKTGSPSYMAPEVIDGKPYDRKCDVYSFAICLWEIYCCEMPYFDHDFVKDFAKLSSAVVHKNLRPSIPKCCPSSLANIMKKCWNVNPEMRPQMVDVVNMLEAIDTSKGGGMLPEDKAAIGCFFLQRPRGP